MRARRNKGRRASAAPVTWRPHPPLLRLHSWA